MSEPRGGIWNRAGRRSGGYRRFEIVVPAVCDCGAMPDEFEWRIFLPTGIEKQRCTRCGKWTGRERGSRGGDS